MKKLAISAIGLLILSLGIYSCTKEEVKSRPTTIMTKAMFGERQSRWGFGWTTAGLTPDKCKFCPFWLCYGKWDDPFWFPPVDDNTPPEISRLYLENGKFCAEIYADNNELPEVLSNISNGKMNFHAPNNDPNEFIPIPSIVISTFQLPFDKIYAGEYPASLVPGTNRVKITFN